MATTRIATPDDAALITGHRSLMFEDNELASPETLAAMSYRFEEWIKPRLADGRYVGLLLEEEGQCVASAGIFFADFPPHWLDVEPVRPYLTNFYTAPDARGRGYANVLLRACVEQCRARGAKVVTLHASKFGKPIYEKFGFEQTNEMMLKL